MLLMMYYICCPTDIRWHYKY